MPTLFVLSHAPHSDPFDARTLDLAREGDGVLLIEDAVYAAAAQPTALAPHIAAAKSIGVRFYALEPDVMARGVASEVPTVDYGGFVDLVFAYDRAVH